jgi:hypothetical protein
MSAAAIVQDAPVIRAWRTVLFRVVAGFATLVVLLLLGGATTLLEPWGITIMPSEDPNASQHLWHQAGWAAQMGVLFGGSLIGLLVRGGRAPALLQFFALGMGGFVLALLPFPYSVASPVMLAIPLVLAGIVVAAYPGSRSIFEFTAVRNRSLLALTAITAIAFAPSIMSDMGLQFAGGTTDEHAVHHHWVSSAYAIILVIAAGASAATTRPGWRVLGALAGAALVYLGIAAVSLPGNPGSIGTVGGIVAIVLGATFLITIAREPSPAAQG